jgi:ribosomal protein S3
LEREAGNLKYGTVGVQVQVHKGQVCKIRFTRQECEAFEVSEKKDKREN